MRIAVRYCGGCNPRYERSQFLNKLKEELKDKCTFEIAKENTLYDMVLVLGGCTSCCASYEDISNRYGVLFVRGNDDYEKTLHSIQEKLNSTK